MADPRRLETRYHEEWLGMAQPVQGLVFSVPALVDAQCMVRSGPATRACLLAQAPPDDDGPRIADPLAFFAEMLGWKPTMYDMGDALPPALSLPLEEGPALAPTLALRDPRKTLPGGIDKSLSDVRKASDGTREAGNASGEASDGIAEADVTPAIRAGRGYTALVWVIPDGLDLDAPEDQTCAWRYPPAAKLDRLLRACRVPIGIITNRRDVRLIYAPYAEASGALTWRLPDLATPAGQSLLDAFVTLLSARRFFGVQPDRTLPAILRDSRTRQAEVTEDLAAQVFDAIGLLLQGLATAAERDGGDAWRMAVERDDDHVYGGLLTVLLRLVFLLYAEERGLMPVDHPVYARHMGLLGLFDQLQTDHGDHPDTMHQRFGAWPRLLALFRAVHAGATAGDLTLPPRRGRLFDPDVYPFLEGRLPDSAAPIGDPEARAAVQVPSVDDGTVWAILRRLLIVDGQRLSYLALAVEQIGSVYERLMGYHVRRLDGDAICLAPHRVWVTGEAVLKVPAGQRSKWLQDEHGVPRKLAGALAKALKPFTTPAEVLAALAEGKASKTEVRGAGRYVIQPGRERQRTSSHYTPRSLTERIVRRTLEPLLRGLGSAPSAADILKLKVCDPAMGSGAFLVEVCRQLGDQLEAARAREGQTTDALAARREVAEVCLYGVDKNPYAVDLARLSLWLITLAADRPFTFVDHALRHGDSLVGLTLDQIRAFHWAPKGQMELCELVVRQALKEAEALRRELQGLGTSPIETREKERLLWDADDAVERARLIGDAVVGAFFAESKKSAREEERQRRQTFIEAWLNADGPTPPEVERWSEQIRAEVPVFHWGLVFPEVFADGGFDAFVGNPPFMGGRRMRGELGDGVVEWLAEVHDASKNADLCAHFFRRAATFGAASSTMGLVATNTIAQGDTREAGLAALLNTEHAIYDATQNLPWPGEAAVIVSVVYLAHGEACVHVSQARLDTFPVDVINSRLRPKPERPPPSTLKANAARCYQGAVILGTDGFSLSPEAANQLVAADSKRAKRIMPLIGGREVNSHPRQEPERYIINFGSMTLAESAAWPDLLAQVREQVKPLRDRSKRKVYRERWWQYAERQPALYGALAHLQTCLVNSAVSKHLIFARQPADRLFTHSLFVYPIERLGMLAALQSRVHESWARLLSSSMKTDLRYNPSDCFDTFPFPDPITRGMDEAGHALHHVRARYMVETQQGLTDTYNRLKDPTCTDPAIQRLRWLHELVDAAVLAAYGWSDIDVPPYGTADEAAMQAFEDEVIDRLFVLNAERAAAEKREAARSKRRATSGKRARPKAEPKNQLGLGLGEGS